MIFSNVKYWRSFLSLKVGLFFVWTVLCSSLALTQDGIVQVRNGQHPEFSRIVFDFPIQIPYRVAQDNERLTVTFDADFNPAFGSLLSTPLRELSNPQITKNDGRTIVTFDVAARSTPRHFRSGTFVVVDILSGQPEGNVTTAQNTDSSSVETEEANNSNADPAETPENADQVRVKGDGENLAGDGNTGAQEALDEVVTNDQIDTSLSVNGQAASDGAETPNSVETLDSDQIIDTDRYVTPSASEEDFSQLESSQSEEAASLLESGTIDVEIAADDSTFMEIINTADDGLPLITTNVVEVDSGIQLTFPWSEEVGSAVFQRGGYLWVIFDRPYGIDDSVLRENETLVAPRIRSLDVRQHDDATVLRMAVRANQNAIMERVDNDWILSLKDTPAKPRFPLRPIRRVEGTQGQQVFIPASDIGRKLEVEDPIVGDLFIVLPMLQEGRGIPESYSYTSAELLETSQGVVVTPLTDFVTVERFREGIAISSGNSDVLSAGRLDRGTGFGDERNASQLSRLIDFKAWRLGEPWEYRKNKTRLLYELSLRPLNDRNDIRWNLARFYLAHNRSSEALSLLELMLDEDATLIQNGEFLAVRGVASFKQRRYEAAETDLSYRDLQSEQDAELWLALIAEAKGEFTDALDHYRRGRDVMGTYDDYDRAEIQLAVIRAAIDSDNDDIAQREMDLIGGLELTPAQLSEVAFHRARLSEKAGEEEQSYVQYDDLSDDSEYWISTSARYAKALKSHERGDLNTDDTIETLEQLRYAWRENGLEIRLFDDLSKLYLDAKQYEKGLDTLRLAISYYPDEASNRNMSLRMGQVFRELFLDGAADNMAPITAIALYEKFQELTPLGTDGDQMIRRLADRLVSVDLLARASDLLEYQVAERLEGAARAQIAARLAKIHILNEEPQRALEIMRATREPRLPQDVEADRRWVESRALIELGRYEEAEVLLESDRSADAEFLRADLFWGAKEWAKFIESSMKLLGDGWRRNEVISSKQRLNLMRTTIAMTFLQDRAGLIEVRRRYGLQMRSGDFANAFELLTNDQELTGQELGTIAEQIANVEKLQSFLSTYRSDFSGR